MSWQSTSLGDCIELVSGAAFKSAMFTDNPDDIPLVKGENIGQGKILWDKSRYWPTMEFEEYSKLVLKPGDIVLAMDRPWVTAGLKYAIISDRDPVSLLVQRVARIRPLANADAKFLKHIVGSKGFLEYIKGIMGGTNVPHISGRQIRDFKCLLPDLETQQCVAAVLSAYDDLIENNRRRIALLEEAARQLYKEWFVRFRFPGHEHVNIVDGVPEGWERLPLSSICTRITDGSHSSPKAMDDGFPMASVKDMEDWRLNVSSCRQISSQDYEALVRYDCKPLEGDVLIAKDGSYLKHCFVVQDDVELVILSSIAILRPNERIDPFLLAFTLKEPKVKEMMAGYVSGVALPRIILKEFRGFKILVPEKRIQNAWSDLVHPLCKQAHVLLKQSDALAKARDLLLPKLMSGAIAV